MTYSTNKILEVLNTLERETGVRQNDTVTCHSLDKLSRKLVSLIQNARGFDSRLTSVSRKQISRLIELEYGIAITSGNLTNLKNSHDFDLLKKVQGLLHVYSEDAEYDFNPRLGGGVEIIYFPEERALASPQLLNILIDRSELDTKVMCEMWSKQGVLGGKRTHFVPEVVNALRAKRFSDVRWSTSCTSRRAFAQLVSPTSIKPLIAKSKSQSEFETLLHEKSNPPDLPRKIAVLSCSSNAKTIEEVDPRYQDLPYFYIYMTLDGCKVGKADSTLRLNNLQELSRRNAFVFCLKKDGSDALSAERIETDFKRYMGSLAIMPVDGKKDHYNQHFADVLNLFDCFINSISEIECAGSHAFVCADYEYTLPTKRKG